MRKFIIFLACLLFMGLQVVQAQRTITGKVTSKEDGSTIPGVTVIVKGTTLGATSDEDGSYEITIPENAKALLFSFVGLKTIEVPIGASNLINVVMEQDVMMIDGVVVTAIGIRKEEKALGYSATSVQSTDLTAARAPSAITSLQGKVAGVNITTASGSPGASTRIISRGLTSLSGNNQPLFVIDGVPILNTDMSNDDLNGGTDFGNRANDINPEDIASVTVLKGASGTALYGSRAANGVIIITTKKGKSATKKGKGPNISFSSTSMFESTLVLPIYQNDYGQGFFGEPDLIENTSWGPKFDEQQHVWGHVVDNSQQIKSYEALENNVKDFFETGQAYTNTVAIANANANSSYYMSYSNINHDGIFPGESDKYKRHNLSFRGSTEVTNGLTASISINYLKKKSSFVPTGQDQSVYDNVMQTPRDISIVDLEDYESKFNTLDNFYGGYTLNPYFLLNEHGNNHNEDRVYGSFTLDYKINSWLTATWRLGTDVANAQSKSWRAIVEFDPNGNNNSNSNTDAGRVTEQSFYNRQINSDLLLMFSKQISKDIGFKGTLGHNVNQRDGRYQYAQVIGLDIPGFYDVSNGSGTPDVIDNDPGAPNRYSKRRLYGVFGSADFSYKNYLYVSIMGRNDWSSTLPEENRDFFYPGANASFVFSEAFPSIQAYIPYGKFRIGWAKAGNDANPYEIHSVFVAGNHEDGFTDLNYPLPGGINGFEQSNIIGNPELQPEITTEIEFGFDMRFLKNRLGIDFTYYNRKTTDLIWRTAIPYSSGYTTQVLNLGEIQNKGIEVLLTGTTIKKKNFTWKTFLNYTQNDNTLVSLVEGLDKVSLGGLNRITLVAIPGEELGLIEGNTAARDDQGRIIVDNTGMPVVSEEKEVFGSTQYDYILGVGNDFTYRNLSLNVLFDIRSGGVMYSRTADITYFAGITPATIYNDRQPFIVPNSVMEDPANPGTYIENTTPITNDHLYTYWGNGGDLVDEAFMVDKSFVKLRELVLTYKIPGKLLNNTFIQEAYISLIGRNLFIWTPEDNVFIDPEVTTFGNDLEAQYGEFSATPTVRSYGFSIRVAL
ncbi:SusC/RagA family TonB-linked outer membrane protein [Bacteroidota bacterium]